MTFSGGKALERRVRRAMKPVLLSKGYPPDALEVFFATDREMRELKRATTGKKVRMVDVLAFEEPRGFPHPGRSVFLGEVYVNAERYAQDPERVLFLVIHGFSHLLGFRHDGERDTIKMLRAEKKFLAEARKGFYP